MPSGLDLEATFQAKKEPNRDLGIVAKGVLLGNNSMFKSILKTVQFYRNLDLIKADVRSQTKAQLAYGKKLGADLSSIAIWGAIAAALAFFALPTLLILIYTLIFPYVGPIWAPVILLAALVGGALIAIAVTKAKIAAIKMPPPLLLPKLSGLSGAKFSPKDYVTHPYLSWLMLAAERPRLRKMDRQSQALVKDLKPKAEALVDAAVLEIVYQLHNGNRPTKAAIIGTSVAAGWLSSKNVARSGSEALHGKTPKNGSFG
jgi:hypothetical protein